MNTENDKAAQELEIRRLYRRADIAAVVHGTNSKKYKEALAHAERAARLLEPAAGQAALDAALKTK